ncbi:ATPase SWSAP1-like [Mercenaria mercenaria]|uniref:ATPase SWSAP1-like n=1 Tax=Mercenaria mercenaria TaxID=6596 RepID=UPI00234E5364|nr:ATPase SWSAP1-like [Mercenaria mercenaria]XP_045196401.2 ATPase SWSAP1-like [Mercenaria mercenaria]XP_053396939.1 ATPase SWSAP1-like [Mercenaria mercenaria]
MTGLLYSLPLTSPWLQTENVEDQSKLTNCLKLLSQEHCPLVFLGDENCGKTVLLFQAAVAYASQDYHVTYISRSPLTQMPLSVHGMTRPETAGLLKTLTFMYMNKVQNLIEYCAAIHSKSLVPDMVIVDDLEYYLQQSVDPSPEVGCARLCAILEDTLSYIQSKSGAGMMMLGCRRKQQYVDHTLKQFKLAVADITTENFQEKLYNLNLQGRTASLNLMYQIQGSGLFVKCATAGCHDT